MATVESVSVWGLLRGLETFSQLMYINEQRVVINSSVTIVDFPRFHHRGVMLDSARHFLPVSVIKKNLVSLSLLSAELEQGFFSLGCHVVQQVQCFSLASGR